MNHYNIALVPKKMSDKVVQCAQQFAEIADQYILGKQSLPHVTLCQFVIEPEFIEQIWQQANKLIPQQTIELTFNELSCITFDNQIFWTSLMPNHREWLTDLHEKTAKMLMKAPKRYDPHMTLFNTRNKDYQRLVEAYKPNYTPICDEFTLALGKSDGIGQLTEILLMRD